MSNVRVRDFSSFRGVPASEPAEADIALINREYAKQPVTVDDIHVRQAQVAHNQYDRTLERFQKAQLERFAETLPGKSLLPGHDTSQLPLGRWFRADTRTRTEPDFPVFQRQQKDVDGGEKATELIPGFENQRQRVTWLDAAFYFTKDAATELMRKNIDSGVYQDVSIGFRYDDLDCDVCKASYLRSPCPHYRGQKLEDGTIVTLTYSGDPKAYEARETSIVYLGAQPMAELTKQLKEGRVDPQALARTSLGVDLAALKEYEALARIHGHQQKSWAFPSLTTIKVSPPIGEDPAPSVGGANPDPTAADAAGDEHMSKLLDRAKSLFGLKSDATEDEAVAAIEKVHGDLKTANGRLEPVKDEQDLGAVAKAAKAGRDALASLKADALAHALVIPEYKDATVLERVIDSHVERGEFEALQKLEKSLRERKAEIVRTDPSADVKAAAEADAQGGEKKEEKAKPSAREIRAGALR